MQRKGLLVRLLQEASRRSKLNPALVKPGPVNASAITYSREETSWAISFCFGELFQFGEKWDRRNNHVDTQVSEEGERESPWSSHSLLVHGEMPG